MLNSILANVIAGLGLLFSGLRLIDANLRQATGRKLRSTIGRLTATRWLAAAVGLVTGALLQSSSGIVFILVSLVSSGLTSVRAVLPVVTWANVGCSVLIFVAVLDLRLGILYLIGVAGAAFAFDRSHRSHWLGALFGVGMLFYGIELMKAGAQPLKDLPWFANALSGNDESWILAFAGGVGFSFVTQSSTAVSILAIGLAETGLLSIYPAMMAIYGANIGSTVARMVVSSGLKGSVRQLTAYQDAIKFTGVAICVPLLYLEVFAGIPLVHALASSMATRIDHQLAIVFLTFNLIPAAAFTALQSPVLRLLERWLPAEAHEDLSKPEFLYDEALNEPATALDLIAREQLRLTRRLTAYLQAMRTPRGSPERERAQRVHAPFATLTSRIEQFEHELMNRQLGPAETERLTKLQSRLSLTVYLEDSLRVLASATESVVPTTRVGEVVSSFVEALDFVLLTLIEAVESPDAESVDLLLQITGDRGELMERIRQECLTDQQAISASDRAVLLQATSIFERVIWMTQRLGRLVDEQRGEERSGGRVMVTT